MTYQKHERTIAYFSMEIGLDASIPTYAGGLGILAGDTLKACADLKVPVVGVTLLNREGYFTQSIDSSGNQHEKPVTWDIAKYMQLMDATVQVAIEGRQVLVRAWKCVVQGESGGTVPIYFLDTQHPSNSEYDQRITSTLYAGDRQYRFCQEMILGIAGVRMLYALGYGGIQKFHMNEGHAALATIELLHRHGFDMDAVREKCVFTTHTPVEAGHDTFDIWMVGRLIQDYYPWHTKLAEHNGQFNMTHLALNLANYVNGVAKKHREVSKHMFPGHEIHAITNGVHSATWVCEPIAKMLDKHISDWRHDPFALRASLALPDVELWDAHQQAKDQLFRYIQDKHGVHFDSSVFTLGFARRSTAYKRADLLFSNIDWLKAIAARVGKIQLVFAGKAHVSDTQGKELIKKLVEISAQLGPQIKMVYLDNYDMGLAKLLVSGVDVWLNTPQRPYEASGTSGMKAAHNGVLHFSTLDGWWIEGCIEGVTGWSIGPYDVGQTDSANEDAADLYQKLEHEIMRIYYSDRNKWISLMRHAIAMNASFFNTHRMVQQYVTNAYLAR